MLTEDYIMRMINLALAVLVKILGFKKAGHYEEAIQHIDQALEILFGMRADLIRRLDDESLLDALTIQDNLDTDRLLVVAELFKEEGDILDKQGHKVESELSRLRALNFFMEVALSEDPGNLSEIQDKIEDLQSHLIDYTFPPETLYTLFVYYTHLGKFKVALGNLYNLADKSISDTGIKHEINEFLHDLLSKSDEEIQKGGLTREEILTRIEML
jgi:tetratricopeptide (TPR) repeat protein